MTDYRDFRAVKEIQELAPGSRGRFLALACGHKVYRYGKTAPKQVRCEYCVHQQVAK